MKMRVFLVNLLAITLLLSGCGFIRSRDNVPQADIERNLHSISKAATTLALNEIYNDRDERLLAAARISSSIDEHVMPLLTQPDASITKSLETTFLNIVPENLQGIMAAAYETFYTHYEFPATSEVLPEPYLSYLRSFLAGVRDGANSILVENNAHIDRDHTIHVGE